MSIFSFALYWLGGRTGMQPWAESVSMVVRKTLREAPLLLLLPSAADVVAWWWCCCCCCCCCSCPEARMFHWSRAAGRGAPLCHGWLARASHRSPRHHSQEGEAMLSASSAALSLPPPSTSAPATSAHATSAHATSSFATSAFATSCSTRLTSSPHIPSSLRIHVATSSRTRIHVAMS